MRPNVALAALLAALALAPAARAQDAAAAEALFREGRTAADAGDYPTACAKFRESNRLDPAVGTVFNLADCEEHLGRLATAWTLFQEAAQRLAAGDPRRQMSLERVAALEPRVPRLRVKLVGPVPDRSVVRRNDVELGPASLDTPLPVDPGDYEVVVTAPGTEQAAYSIHLEPGQSRLLEVRHGPPLAAGQPDAAAEQGGKSTLGWVLGGVGVAGLAVGGVAGVMVLGKKSTADDHCPDKRCDAEGFDAVEAGETLGVVSTVGFVVGAAGLGAGAYLLLSGGAAPEREAALGVRPAPGGAALSLRARW